MAITKIHAIKSTLGKALAYIENPDKTDGQMLVSGYNCEPQTASIDFEMTAVLAHKARNLKRNACVKAVAIAMQYMPLSHIVPTSYTPIVTPQCFTFKCVLQDYKRKSV